MENKGNICRRQYGYHFAFALLASLFLFAPFTLSKMTGQERIVPRPSKRDLGEQQQIDISLMQIYYAFNATNLKDRNTYMDYQCLEYGKEYVKYYSVFLIEGEKRAAQWNKDHPQADGFKNIDPPGRLKNWSEHQFTEFYIHGGQLTAYCQFAAALRRYNSWYEEDYPTQEWTIHSDTLHVCTIPCQKATCHFRGRDYIAWFAKSIPLKYGPGKFGGWPGPILKLEDTKHQYVYECVKITTEKKPIHKYQYNGFNKKSRKDVVKLQKLINEDYFQTVGSINISTGEKSSNYIPYEPMELE